MTKVKSRPPAVARRRSEGVWLDIAPGVQLKMLRVVDPATGERTALLRIEPGLSCPEHDHSEVEDVWRLCASSLSQWSLVLLHRLYGTDVNHRPAGQPRRGTADRLNADRERRAVPQVNR